MRVLIAYEYSYRCYADALQGTIQGHRPGAAVSLVRAEELGDEVARLEPHLVVCDRPNNIDPNSRAAWARLSDDPDVPSEFFLGGRRRSLENPGFEELMEFIDEAEELVRSGQELGGGPYAPACVEGASSERRPEGVLGSRYGLRSAAEPAGSSNAASDA